MYVCIRWWIKVIVINTVSFFNTPALLDVHGFAVSVFTMEPTYLLNLMTLLLLIVNYVIHCLFADLISKLDKRRWLHPGRFKCLPRVSREPAESNPPQNASSWTVSPLHCPETSTTPVRKQLSAKKLSIQRSLLESFDEHRLDETYNDNSPSPISSSTSESDEFHIDDWLCSVWLLTKACCVVSWNVFHNGLQRK